MKIVPDILLQFNAVTCIKRPGYVGKQILVQFFSSLYYLFTIESDHLSSFKREIKNPLTYYINSIHIILLFSF